MSNCAIESGPSYDNGYLNVTLKNGTEATVSVAGQFTAYVAVGAGYVRPGASATLLGWRSSSLSAWSDGTVPVAGTWIKFEWSETV